MQVMQVLYLLSLDKTTRVTHKAAGRIFTLSALENLLSLLSGILWILTDQCFTLLDESVFLSFLKQFFYWIEAQSDFFLTFNLHLC